MVQLAPTMPITQSLRWLRCGLAGALVVVSTVSAAAQGKAPAAKLDGVLRARARQLTGRSRVIVQFTQNADARVITAERGEAGRALTSGRAQVAELDNRALAALASNPNVVRVMIDRPAFATMERTGAAIGATLAREQFDVTGKGVGVAVIDSGITNFHHDLYSTRGRARRDDIVVHFKDFTRPLNSRIWATELPTDEYGHGTHVAGIIAGNGYESDGRRTGVAPGVHLIGLKVLDRDGHGYISDVIAAIDYAISIRDVYNIRIINLSVGSGVFETYRLDPLAQAAKRAVDAGIVVVTAAGNLGHNDRGDIQYGGITSPGNAPWVLTVGASSHQGTPQRSDDTIGDFSSRGPTWIDFSAKPDIVAPGVGIESLSDPYSTLYSSMSEYLLDGTHANWYKPYLSLSGTSMSAPVVAGTIALMLEANPHLTPNAVKAILQYTAQVRSHDSLLAQGAGLLNARGAVRMARFFAQPRRALGRMSDRIENEVIPWSRHIIWGNYRVQGGVPLPGSNAWTAGLTWGALKTSTGADVVWGAHAAENIVWSTSDDDNIVWSTADNANIVWSTAGATNDNIVCSTQARDNDNIVWSTDDSDNIVWSTALVQNVVWGMDCGGRNCVRVIWGARRGTTVWGNVSADDNIVWSTDDNDNIVWSTDDNDNIVWSTDDNGNIVWSTADNDNIVWSTSAAENIVWSTAAAGFDNIVWSTGAADQVLWPPPAFGTNERQIAAAGH